MSKPVAVAWQEPADELWARYVTEQDSERHKRLQALWLVRSGERVGEAGRLAGVGERTLFRWLQWYRTGGLEAVLRRVPGHGAAGAPHRLTAEQREAVLARARQGEFRTSEQARAWVHAEYGVAYRPGGIWSALRRLGVRSKVPRPVAEPADPAVQEAWRSGG